MEMLRFGLGVTRMDRTRSKCRVFQRQSQRNKMVWIVNMLYIGRQSWNSKAGIGRQESYKKTKEEIHYEGSACGHELSWVKRRCRGWDSWTVRFLHIWGFLVFSLCFLVVLVFVHWGAWQPGLSWEGAAGNQQKIRAAAPELRRRIVTSPTVVPDEWDWTFSVTCGCCLTSVFLPFSRLSRCQQRGLSSGLWTPRSEPPSEDLDYLSFD